MNKTVDLLERALGQTDAVPARTGDRHAALPTPCVSWTVADLVAHLIHGLDKYLEQARGGQPDWSAATPDPG